jgi:hypothetical protein
MEILWGLAIYGVLVIAITIAITRWVLRINVIVNRLEDIVGLLKSKQ